jgi:hypothetical protein
MVLTEDQLRALAQGEPIPVRIADKDCVVVQREVFEHMRGQVLDDSDATPRDTYPMVLKAIDKDDENHDQYLAYLEDQ